MLAAFYWLNKNLTILPFKVALSIIIRMLSALHGEFLRGKFKIFAHYADSLCSFIEWKQ